MGAILQNASVGARPVPLKRMTFQDGRVHAVLLIIAGGFLGSETSRKRCKQQQHSEEKCLSHGGLMEGSIMNIMFGHGGHNH